MSDTTPRPPALRPPNLCLGPIPDPSGTGPRGQFWWDW